MKRKITTKKNQLVVPLGSGWAVKTDGDTKFSIIADKKSEAVAFAKGVAANNNAEVIIYAKDGSIVEKNGSVNKRASLAKS